MSNRYAITFLHWLTSVLAGSILLAVASGMSTEVLMLSLVFGGGASVLFFLFSLLLVPRILKSVQSKSTRIAALTIYSAACCFGGFVGLVAFDILKWGDIFSSAHSSIKFFEAPDNAIGFAFYAFMIATMLSSVLWAAVYKPKDDVPPDHGVLDQL